MKKNFSFALFSLCSLMMLAPSCSSEDTPAVPEVGNFGKPVRQREVWLWTKYHCIVPVAYYQYRYY